jgi:aspartate/tyrosine/aromatic aminotransferase
VVISGAVLLLGAHRRSRCGGCARQYGLYAVDSGRICVAGGLNSRNIDYVAQSIASVLV